MKHTASWILWFVTAMILLLTTRNPFYLLIAITSLLLLGNRIAKIKHQDAWLKYNLRFLVTMFALSTLINSLFTHSGNTTLFAFPQDWLLIGGDITLESMVYGAINGLVIGSLYLLFNIINLALSIKQLTRLIPSMFHPITMVVTISLTFIPSIQQRAREIKEAQLIRGNPMKKISDWLPLMMPLLVTSLEKSIMLSESMTSRGFHSQQSAPLSNLTILGLSGAAFAVFAGWVLHLFDYPVVISILLYISGGILLVFIFLIHSRHSRMTHFHKEVWNTRDILAVILISAYSLALLTGLLTNRLPSFTFTPYPALALPTVNIHGILLSLAPITPLFFAKND